MAATLQVVPGESIAPKFGRFNVVHLPYKHIGTTPILTSVFTPKDVPAGDRPVLIHWHGGGLVTGSRLWPDWWADWILELALAHNAIVLSPDYRLLPESTGLEILSDARDFYRWLLDPTSTLAAAVAALSPSTRADPTRLLVTGESAGGWHALQSGFLLAATQPHAVAAIIAQYPMVEIRAPHFTVDSDKQLLDPPLPQVPLQVINAHVAALAPGAIATERDNMSPLGAGMIQRGLYGRFFAPASEDAEVQKAQRALFPLEALEDAVAATGGGSAAFFPPTWLLHGKADSLVPYEGTEVLASKLPAERVHLTLAEGEEHGFDAHEARRGGLPATLGTDWVKEGVDFISKFWPDRSA